VAADFAAAAATTPTIPADTPSTATASQYAKGSTEPPTCPTVPTARRQRRWRLVAIGAAGALVLLLALIGALALGRRLLGPPAPKVSKALYTFHVRGRSPVTGRLITPTGGEKRSWMVKTDGGPVEIPYSEVTIIETQVGK
jgi:hypothetical protein